MKISNPFKQKIEDAAKNRLYLEEIRKPVWEKSFLLEGGQGKNINGNAFALLRSIRSQAKYDDYDVYFSVMPDMLEKAERRVGHYGLQNVQVVINGSDIYKKALARAKYLITDNSFTPYFVKREEQVYLNTWHGTPLKALGRTDLRNTTSLANVQANMLKADYLLHPNHFTREIMMKDYMVDRLFRHRTVILDYPRNDALYRQEFRDEILSSYGLAGKRLIAYMPTWRGTGRTADIDEQVAEARDIIGEISRRLLPDEILCVNLHFLIGQNLDVSSFDNVMMFPQEYETYDFLALCDTLITDYSSVSVDFAGTGRDIILYIYDYEKYKADKGFYIDVKMLPFMQAETMDELISCLHRNKSRSCDADSFTSRNSNHEDGSQAGGSGTAAIFSGTETETSAAAMAGDSDTAAIFSGTGAGTSAATMAGGSDTAVVSSGTAAAEPSLAAAGPSVAAADHYVAAEPAYTLDSSLLCDNRGDSCRQILDLLTEGRTDGLEIDDYDRPTDTMLVYFGNIRREENRRLMFRYMEGLTAEEKKKTVIAFENALLPETIEILEQIDKDLDFVRIQRNFYKSRVDYISTAVYKKTGAMKTAAYRYYERESRRLLRFMNLSSLSLVMFQSVDRSFILSYAPARTLLYEFPAKTYPDSCSQLFRRPQLLEDLRKSYDEVRVIDDSESQSF